MAPPLKKINGSLVYENDDVELVESFVKQGYRTLPILYVNGKKVPSNLAAQATPNQTLLTFLRKVLGLTGSKLGCAEGGCGACTVMLSRMDNNNNNHKDGNNADGKGGELLHYAVNACLMPVLAADGCHITTVEGVGTVQGDNLHPIQKAMVDMHGSQCGFCTPGIIVAIYALFANNPTKDYIEEHLDGNLCRCTGYRPIWDAARSLCTDSKIDNNNDDIGAVGPCGTPCRDCPERNTCEMECNVNDKNIKEKEEEKKVDVYTKMYCSTSSDKVAEYKDTLSKTSEEWLSQPNDMFPEELCTIENNVAIQKPLIVVDKTFQKAGTWFKPTTLKELLHLMQKFDGGCKIVVGNTEIGIETKFKHSVYPRLIFPSQSISTLYTIEQTPTHLSIGSCAPLSTLQHTCEGLMDDDKFRRIAKPIHDMLRWFASTQIRNVACLGGNLVTASPISDMNPMLAALGAKLVISSLNTNGIVEKRSVPVSEFFISYRKVDLKPHELVESIQIPLTKPVFEYVFPFKQARRREDDISIVTAGMRIEVIPSKEGYSIGEVGMAFGGMAPRTVVAIKTIQNLSGKSFCKETFVDARRVIQNEMDLPDDVPGGQAQFRKSLASSFVYKLFLMTAEAIQEDVELITADPQKYNNFSSLLPLPVVVVDAHEKSGAVSFLGEKKPTVTGTQKYPMTDVTKGLEERYEKRTPLPMAEQAARSNNVNSGVGKAAPHASGPLHCTGEALYTDDVPLPTGSLEASLILATECNSKLLSIDISAAMKTPGVTHIFTHEDIVKIGGNNHLGPIVKDEFLFLPLGENVPFIGQVLGICIAETLESAQAGARSVEVQYEKNEGNTIVSIEDAIEAGSYYEDARHTMTRSKPVEKMEGDEIITVSGKFRCGGQEHFYLETNSTLAVPSDSATNLTVYTSTQAVTKTQTYCASATGMHASKVVVRMKRMGGGFGGKETRSAFSACAAAVAAKLSNRPVRLTLDRDVDMSITGGRHAFMAKYQAQAIVRQSKEVILSSLTVDLYNNGGCAFDLSGPVMDRALFHLDGPYYFPEFHAVGVPCKTVQPPHTAFRGFGGPQGLATTEYIMDHLASACKVSGDDLRRNNMYSLGQATPFGMIIGEKFSGKWNVPRMWDQLQKELGIQARYESIAEFNSKHRWVKRGFAITPTKFGIAFTAKFMNQGGALVHLYTDGSVLVSHGGTEMGQGLHTKVCQMAAQAFGISLDDVYINDTSSDKVANTIPTAASMSTDMYGMATLDACQQILERIEPFRKKLGKDASLKDIATAAHFERVDLSAHGFFALDDDRCGYDWAKSKPDNYDKGDPDNSWKGHPFNYFTQGVAYSEVEIDVLTGNHTTLRSDVLVDVGASINPALDIGQIEGAFIQGMGWCTLEEVVYGDDDHTWIRPTGKTFTTGPGTYKIPAFNDVPQKFNVSLLDNVDNPFAVHSSKAIGEPPFFLGCSVFFAIKDAIKAARVHTCNDEWFDLDMPATSERIRMLCADEIATDCVRSIARETTDEKMAQNFKPKGSF